MIKEHIKRKFIITTFALIIFLVTMSFPSVEEEIKNVTISYTSGEVFPIYLLDGNSYVARTAMAMQDNSILDMAKEILEILTIGSKKSTYIPNFFEPILPKDTKVLSIDLQDKTLKINFSQEFFKIAAGLEEKMLECLVFSLTEIEGVEGIILFVEGNMLEKVPNQDTPLPPILTRDMGVNKIYNLNSLKNVSKTTIYYLAKEQDTLYYVPVTLLDNSEKNKIEIIIERLKSMPIQKTNLMSYLNANTELTNYELLENEVLLSFSPLLYEGLASSEITEEVKYAISLSMKDTLNVEKVVFIEN